MAANARKLRNILDYIETHQNEWNQGEWVLTLEDAIEKNHPDHSFCGTRFCFAGFAIQRSKRFKFVRDVEGKLTDDVRIVGDKRTTNRQRIFNVQDAAAVELGLTPREAARLFDGSNDLYWLRKTVDVIIAGLDRDADEREAVL